MLLPQCLWRLPFAVHFEMGMRDQGGMPSPWISVPYVLGLSVITELLALLSFALVRGWGEVVPARVPGIGGRRVPPKAAVACAVVGGLAATAFWAPTVLSWFHVIPEGPGYVNGWWEALAKVCIAPGTLWGPMVLALACAYAARRRGTTR
ncbi:hypothetical protein ACFQ2B_18310 [Streptomyces stramineus]